MPYKRSSDKADWQRRTKSARKLPPVCAGCGKPVSGPARKDRNCAECKAKKDAANKAEWHVRKNFGLTRSAYDAMLDAAAERPCRICDEFKSRDEFHLDHCHKTGAIRGFICGACNRLLGRVEKHYDRILAYLGG